MWASLEPATPPPTQPACSSETGVSFHTDVDTGETNAGLDAEAMGAECDGVGQGRAAGGARV